GIGARVVSVLGRPRPGAAAQGSQTHGGLRGANAVFGLPLLADAAGAGANALGVNGVAGPGRRGDDDPAVQLVRVWHPEYARGGEPAELAGRPCTASDR